jgi:hypothetical protein
MPISHLFSGKNTSFSRTHLEPSEFIQRIDFVRFTRFAIPFSGISIRRHPEHIGLISP